MLENPQEMIYYSFSAAYSGGTMQGRVCRFEKDARDRLFRDPGTYKEVAKITQEKIGNAWTFHPAIEVKPGTVITIVD